MSQVRLSSLPILSIESRRLEDVPEVDTDKIIDSFADIKALKKSF